MSPAFGGNGAGPCKAELSGNGPRDKNGLPCLLPDAACASHPCAGPWTLPCSPKGCPFSPLTTPVVPAPALATSQALGGRMGMVTGMGSIPTVPHWSGKEENCRGGKIPPCEAGTLPATPGRAVAPLLRDGGASAEQLQGSWLPVGGGRGAAVPVSPCTRAGKGRQGPGMAGMCSVCRGFVPQHLGVCRAGRGRVAKAMGAVRASVGAEPCQSHVAPLVTSPRHG